MKVNYKMISLLFLKVFPNPQASLRMTWGGTMLLIKAISFAIMVETTAGQLGCLVSCSAPCLSSLNTYLHTHMHRV